MVTMILSPTVDQVNEYNIAIQGMATDLNQLDELSGFAAVKQVSDLDMKIKVKDQPEGLLNIELSSKEPLMANESKPAEYQDVNKYAFNDYAIVYRDDIMERAKAGVFLNSKQGGTHIIKKEQAFELAKAELIAEKQAEMQQRATSTIATFLFGCLTGSLSFPHREGEIISIDSQPGTLASPTPLWDGVDPTILQSQDAVDAALRANSRNRGGIRRGYSILPEKVARVLYRDKSVAASAAGAFDPQFVTEQQKRTSEAIINSFGTIIVPSSEGYTEKGGAFTEFLDDTDAYFVSGGLGGFPAYELWIAPGRRAASKDEFVGSSGFAFATVEHFGEGLQKSDHIEVAIAADIMVVKNPSAHNIIRTVIS